MKKFVVACLTFVSAVLVTPAGAFSPASFLSPEEMRLETIRVGLPTEGIAFETFEDENVNAGFIPAGIYCAFWTCQQIPTTLFFVGDWSDAEYEIRLTTFFHELGHYIQFLENRDYDEWDADVFAVGEMCRRGYDGVYWFERVQKYFMAKYNRGWNDLEGTSHGSSLQRVENVRIKVRDCLGPQA